MQAFKPLQEEYFKLPTEGGEPFIAEITNEQYHKSDGLSNSALNLILECPYKYYFKYILGKSLDDESDALNEGSLIHSYILEPELFKEEYALMPEIRRGTKEFKLYEAASGGKKLIKPNDYEMIKEIKSMLKKHWMGCRLFQPGQVEKSIFWFDKELKVWLKTRPDFFTDTFIFDLKTTASAKYEDFQRSMIKYGYHRQAALALDGLAALYGDTHFAVMKQNFINICVEKKPPYMVAAYMLSNEAIEQGRAEYKYGIKRYLACKHDNVWTGYNNDCQEMVLPAWTPKLINNGDK